MIESRLRALAVQWLGQPQRAVIIEVRQARGSTPRQAGTRMLVRENAVFGTIGGGHLEWQAIRFAREALQEAELATKGSRGADDILPAQREMALGPSLGQCCGGHVTLQWRWLDESALREWIEPEAMFHLQLYGAGHVGCEVARLLARLECRVDWIDEREEAFPAAGDEVWRDAPHIRRVVTDGIAAEVAEAPPGAHLLIMTHSHALDLDIVTQALKRPDTGFVGLIGSATKRARFTRQLLERQIPEQALTKLICPIGLPGLQGKEPAVIAISVVAQLLQTSAGTTSQDGFERTKMSLGAPETAAELDQFGAVWQAANNSAEI